MPAASATKTEFTTFTCESCHRKWRKPGDQTGRRHECPACRVPVVAQVQPIHETRSATLFDEQVRDTNPACNSRNAALHIQPLKRGPAIPVWALIAAVPAVLLVGFISLCGLLVLASVARSTNTSQDGTPATSLTKADDTAARTKIAWDAMQTIDTNLREQEFASPGHKCRTVALQYSQMELNGVDPKLADHVQDAIAVHREKPDVLEKLESEFATLNRKTADVAKTGAFFGSLVSDKPHRERGETLGGVVGRIFSRLSQNEARQELKAKYLPQLEQIDLRFKALNAREVLLAKTLSEEYRRPFTDLY